MRLTDLSPSIQFLLIDILAVAGSPRKEDVPAVRYTPTTAATVDAHYEWLPRAMLTAVIEADSNRESGPRRAA